MSLPGKQFEEILVTPNIDITLTRSSGAYSIHSAFQSSHSIASWSQNEWQPNLSFEPSTRRQPSKTE